MALPGRTKASILWGATGALTFLILGEAYLFLSTATIPLTSLLLTGLGVFVAATVVSYLAEPRIHALTE